MDILLRLVELKHFRLQPSCYFYSFCFASIFLFTAGTSLSAQNCSVNAGINLTVCAQDPLNLNGQVSGILASGAQPLWTQVAGPTVLIQNPKSLTSGISGIVGGM